MTYEIASFEKPLYRNFCVPEVCRQLMNSGITTQTLYEWQLKRGLSYLNSNAFDYDDYYVSARNILNKLDPPTYIFPAYSAADLLSVMPDVCIVKNENIFTVGIPANKTLTAIPLTEEAPRLPDALGLLLLKCISEHLIVLDESFQRKIAIN